MKVLELTDRAVRESSITEKRCFACGGPPSSGIGEHVFPKWLQKQFQLFDKRLTLINGTLIPYRKLTVPCCIDCNTGFLSQIESSAQAIIQRGAILSANDELTLARWLSKILIGILVKETGLAFNRSKPDVGSILHPAIIDELHHCHFVMQSARKPTTFRCLHGKFPFSLYSYSVPTYTKGREFDLSTNLYGQSIAIRLGPLGVIFINDGGLQLEVGKRGPFGLLGSELSELHFREIAARVHYKAALRDATHSYITSENDEFIQVEQMHVKSFSGYLPGGRELRIFRDWDEAEFSHAMAAYMGVDRSKVFDEKTQTCGTTLFDAHGNLIAGQRDDAPTS
jgi:hypothetical protein